MVSSFQSTLPAGEATAMPSAKKSLSKISIHASRGGSDRASSGEYPAFTVISIHASREGSDSGSMTVSPVSRDFNPRFPRGKRQKINENARSEINFNPRFPRGKRHSPLPHNYQVYGISIHASREGSDELMALLEDLFDISIHASREGSDL